MLKELESLAARIGQGLLADRLRLQRRVRAVELGARRGQPVGPLLQTLASDLDRSIERRARRAASLPRPRFEKDLPILARREDIAGAIQANPVCIVCGETGSGKTTQLPQICLSLGRGVAGMIGHTQPRRIAARTVAARIAEELGAAPGGGGPVGYKVRFGDRTGADTHIKVMTDGILLAETQGDPMLEQYDTLIIDEAHERSLNIDFLLGYLRGLVARRPELKVIITSATIDPDRFSRHFGGAPIVEVSGRTYPVEVRYRPVGPDDEEDDERSREAGLLRAVDELAREGPGDILVFLSGEREIRQSAEALRKHHPAGTEVLPLYARLSAAEQMRVFQPHAGRRIVLATNVAETSLTVPGIRYVVDTGLARISRYSHRTKVQRLPIEPISRASAEQRKGRCGRVAPGVCIRLYSEEDFASREEFTEPEILRTNLASVILRMKALHLGEVERFPFVEPPDGRMIRDGFETLHELGAIDERNELTPLGVRLARLPIDPRVGRMLLAAHAENCLKEVLVIAAALSVQDPRERPLAAQEQADQAHGRFKHEDSDFLALVNLWNAYHEQSEHLSHSKLRKWCRDGFLSAVRMREWVDIHRQLHALLGDMGFHENTSPAGYDAVHRSLVSGLLSNIGRRTESFEYAGARGSKFHIFPGSGLFKKGPHWLVAAEIVQTSRLYARTVARVQPEWIERLAAHVVKRSYADPHWDADAGHASAFERVTLFGLELVARRRVNYGPIDTRASRELFIHHALVQGECRNPPEFLRHNQGVIEQVRTLEAKARAPDIMADVRALFAFYDARIPPDVCSTATLEAWLRRAGPGPERALRMTIADVAQRPAAEVTPDKFPDWLPLHGSRLEIGYALDPGGAGDGVTITVPISGLAQFDPPPHDRSEWLVPGMLKDKVLALFKSLPKAVRKALDPMPALAQQCALAMPFAQGSLYDALSAKVLELREVRIPRDAWQPRAVPDHLRLNVRIVDERGKEIARGRDMSELWARLGPRAMASYSRAAQSPIDRDGLTTWDFGDLPGRTEVDRGGASVVGYGALVDKGTSVSLRLLSAADGAERATRAGLRRLFALQARDELSYQLRLEPALQRMTLHYAPLGRPEELARELTDLAAERAFLDAGPVRTKSEFEKRLTEGWRRIGPAMREACALVDEVLGARHAAVFKITEKVPAAWGPAIADIRQQIDLLTPRGFALATPWERLRHLPRYFAAILKRLEKLANAGLARDTRALAELAPHWARLTSRPVPAGPDAPPPDPELVAYRWMLEEFRVSLFAQELGTAAPVSARRLDEQWVRVKA